MMIANIGSRVKLKRQKNMNLRSSPSLDLTERLTAAPVALTMLVSLAAVNLLIKERHEVKNP